MTHSGRGEFLVSPKATHAPWGDASRSSPKFRVPQHPESRSSDASQNQAPAEAGRGPESARVDNYQCTIFSPAVVAGGLMAGPSTLQLNNERDSGLSFS